MTSQECLKTKVHDILWDEADRFDDYLIMHKAIDCNKQTDFANFFTDHESALHSAQRLIGSLPETATAEDILSVFDGAKSNFTLYVRFVVFKILQDLKAI